jgi:predicted DCC family thiol-disulfide oxidoreductase YuxK
VENATGIPLPGEEILLYDGTCGFCARSIQFVLSHERPKGGTLAFAPLGGATARQIAARFPGAGTGNSMVFYLPSTAAREAKALLASDAAIAVGRYLGGLWGVMAVLASLVPRGLRNAAYDAVARHRHRIAGDACVVPTEDQKVRFRD